MQFLDIYWGNRELTQLLLPTNWNELSSAFPIDDEYEDTQPLPLDCAGENTIRNTDEINTIT